MTTQDNYIISYRNNDAIQISRDYLSGEYFNFDKIRSYITL